MTNSFLLSATAPRRLYILGFVAAFLSAGASCAYAQSTFGKPVIEPAPAHRDMVVVNSATPGASPIALKKPSAVTRTQRALAAITASQASGAQVVTLPYQEHGTYNIPIREGMFSTFALPKSEPIQQFAVSNPSAVQLQVNAPTNTAMVKLIQPITVVGTIVTNAHIYYINIVPAGDGDPWYQGVNWSFGTESFGGSTFNSGVYTSAAAPVAAASSAVGAADTDPSNDLFTGQPNFAYKVTGDAPFKPTAIWDNGRFTWIQFAKNVQALPALFVQGQYGLEIVNYTVHADGTQLLVNRLMPGFVLKLGKAEIHVKADR